MKKTVFILLLIISSLVNAQQRTGTILPCTTFTNQTSDTLFYLPKQKLETIIEREEISNAIIQIFTDRNAESDSMLLLKTQEAYDWYNKLMETDSLLEKSDLQRVKEQQKARKKPKSGLEWEWWRVWLPGWFCEYVGFSEYSVYCFGLGSTGSPSFFYVCEYFL